jgi:hypothetical protein
MLHKGKLWSWTQGEDQIVWVQDTLQQRLIRIKEDLIVREDYNDEIF